eukprot:gene5762-7953_t
MNSYELIPNGLQFYVDKFSRPAPVTFSRVRPDLQFAVQLMRQSYNATDELDCVAMDEFQKDFFLFRQNEWEDYRSKFKNMLQGDLADPAYFDFISFCQYAVISNKIRNGKSNFIEKFDANGNTRVVRRSPAENDQESLANIHESIVGEKLLQFILDKYPAIITQTSININLEEYLRLAQLILDVFTINGYAASTKIEAIGSTSSTSKDGEIIAKVATVLPINLWSIQILQQRNDRPINDFEIKVLRSLAKRSNISFDSVLTTVANNVVSYTIKISSK